MPGEEIASACWRGGGSTFHRTADEGNGLALIGGHLGCGRQLHAVDCFDVEPARRRQHELKLIGIARLVQLVLLGEGHLLHLGIARSWVLQEHEIRLLVNG